MRIEPTTPSVAVRTHLPPLRAPRELRQPMKGNDVAELQRQLAAAGFDPGGIDGEYGPNTELAVRAYQRARGLDVDGVVGPDTRRALRHEDDFTPVKRGPVSLDPSPRRLTRLDTLTATAAPAPMPAAEAEQRARVLELAGNEVGTLETGQNGGDVLKYPEYFGRGREKYCADFVSYVFSQAGIPLDQCSCEGLKDLLVERGQWKGRKNPQPGDVVIFDFDRDGVADHTGIVKSVNADGTITTIEGNTAPRGKPDGVYEMTRHQDETILGYGYPG